MDLKHAYFHIKLADRSKPKTAFNVGGKNYQYMRPVMELSSSAHCWQRLLTKVLSEMLFKYAIVHFDDILLFEDEDEKMACKPVMESEQFIIDNGILCHGSHPKSKRMDERRLVLLVVKQLFIPKILREDIVIAYHNNNCHVGQEHLYNTLKVK